MTATACKTKSCFEFLLSNVTKITNTVYSPPFGTSHDMFWQLEFIPNSSEEPNHCAAFLFAIPNHEEANNPGTWSRRNTLNAKIYLKNARNQTFLKKQAVKMNSFSTKLSGWGWEAFYIKANLPDHVLFGVEFERVEMGLVSQKWPLPNSPNQSEIIPHDLLKAWESLLNNPITSDVQFDIQGQIIYANSFILSSRSKYFQLILQEMLRFLYTNNVTFVDKKDEKNSHGSALELYRISDKYLIDDLRELAKAEIFKDLNVNDAAEFLFGTAWQYPELKEQAMKFFVNHFPNIRQTIGFKNILADPSSYPAFIDTFNEALAELFPVTGSVNTGKPVKEGS
ncbi:17710_t:CDS:2 [Entrophospora sp. SA101]|nr:6597_t:CDS:2 [Entrophospora sp. SA101]CAJ0763837.1 17710_t:CDS:2 [Entrophospora sp. SA101]CAJ0833756.1 11433_t:CDS:2 [Entrophospora sp. SA101]